MRIFKIEDLELNHLVTSTYIYPPKNIRVEAIQITPENIGALALEFEAELYYNQESGASFSATVERKTESGKGFALLPFRSGFWLVPLRDEIHLIDDYTFECTFVEDIDPRDKTWEDVQMQQREGALTGIPDNLRSFSYQQPLEVPNQAADETRSFEETFPKVAAYLEQVQENPVDVANKKLFKTEDRVVHVATSQKGVVVNPMTEGGHVEVLMNSDGQTYVFHPNQLELIYPEIRTEKTED